MQNLVDIEHAMVMFIKRFPQYENENMTPSKFTDGWAFATMLQSAEQFKLSYSDLDQSTQKWTFKLANLKKIINKIEEYFEDTVRKGIKTKDIDLIEIAKNNNIEETIKLFELVIATLTEAPNKENHISIIMGLDERSQAAFMEIIQNILEHRIQEKMESKEDNIIQIMDQLQTQNNLLRQQVEQVLEENRFVEKQVSELKIKLTDCEEELQKIKCVEINNQIDLGSNQNEQLKHMVENLKEKLLQTVREHQTQISKYKEEISVLEELYTKMQSQKRDVKPHQLEKELKKKTNNSTGNTDQQPLNLSRQNITHQVNEIEKQEIEELRNEVEGLKKKIKDADRQNNRLKRNLDKLSSLDSDKKKLQRLVLDLNNEKKEQVEVLLHTAHEIYVENHRLKVLLRKNNIEVEGC